jgi:hypothetical protein
VFNVVIVLSELLSAHVDKIIFVILTVFKGTFSVMIGVVTLYNICLILAQLDVHYILCFFRR